MLILCLLSSILSSWDFRLHIHCVFNASDFLPLQASLFPPPSSHCDPVQPPEASAADRQGKRIRCPCAFSTHPHFPDIQSTEVHEPLSLQTRLLVPTTGRGTTPLWGCFKSLTPWRSGSCRGQTPFWSWCCTSTGPLPPPTPSSGPSSRASGGGAGAAPPLPLLDFSPPQVSFR